jgi:thioesterase domain-containing protein
LGDDQPVHGLQVFGLEDVPRTAQGVDLAWLARRYVDEVRALDPVGPYRLAAYCADSVLALEMAHLLRRDGKAVAFLGFIDVVWPYLRPLAPALLHGLATLGPPYAWHRVRRRLAHTRTRWLHSLRVPGLAMAASTTPPAEHVRLADDLTRALHTWPVTSWPGAIDFFISAETAARNPRELRVLVQLGHRIHDVPGYHDLMFTTPHLLSLATQMRARLTALDNDSAP